VADRGYFKIEDIEACEKAGLHPYVPRSLGQSRPIPQR
jgi:transposase